MRYSELTPEQKKSVDFQREMMSKKPADIDRMCDTGMFNSIIEGYCRIVFDDLGLTDKLKGYSFYSLFDMVSAKQAREKSD